MTDTTDEHLDALVVEWNRRRKLGQEVPPEEICAGEPELLEALKARTERVKRTDALLEPHETTDDGNLLTVSDIRRIAVADETLPQSRLTVAEFTQALTTSELLPAESVRAIQQKPSVTDARELAVALVVQRRLTPYQACVLLEGRKDPLVLDRYAILERLDAGGMGQVYKALHRPMERIVALKMPPPNSVSSPEKVKRFQREVRAAAKLSHANIVTSYDACEAGGVHFLVMELVDGQDLHKLVKRDGPLPISKALNYIVQAATGLEHAHANGIVHRDMKPSNLLLDNKGTVKVLDLGLARFESHTIADVVSQELTEAGMPMGTVAFMPPEQALDAKHADHRSDIYSLGCTLYFLLTGRPPYRRDTPVETIVAHREQAIPSLRTARKDVPETLDAIYCRMLAKRPEDRYQSMTDVIEALKHVQLRDEKPVLSGVADGSAPSLAEGTLAETLLNQPGVDTASKIQSKPPRWRATALIALGLLLVGLVLGGIIFQRKPLPAEGLAAGKDMSDVKREAETAVAATDDADDCRQTAEWVLSKGGKVTVRVGNDDPQVIDAFGTLPPREFQLEGVDLSYIAVTDNDLQHLASLADLQYLDLEGSTVTDVEMRCLAHLANLTKLNLGGARITDDGLQQLLPLQRLIELNVGATEITDAGLRHMQGFPRLTHIWLHKTRITDQGLQEVAKLRQLAFLAISYNTQIGAEGLRSLRGLIGLSGLDIGPDVTDEGLAHVAELRGLMGLALWNDHVTDEEVTQLERMQSLTSLRFKDPSVLTATAMDRLKEALPHCTIDFSLASDLRTDAEANVSGAVSLTDTAPVATDSPNLSRAAANWVLSKGGKVTIRVGRAAPRVIDASGSLPPRDFRLEGINLSYTAVSDNDLRHLDALKDLQSLNLTGTSVSDVGMASVAHLENLTTLFVGATKITDAGLEHLLTLQRLIELDIGVTGVSDDGIRLLDRFPELSSLWLQGTNVTDKGLQGIANSTRLTSLRINHTPKVSAEGLKSIRDLPNLTGLEIGPVSDQALACIVDLTGLLYLNLWNDPVTDEGLNYLEKMQGLRLLGLKEGSVTPMRMERLQQALPNCKISLHPDPTVPRAQN